MSLPLTDYDDKLLTAKAIAIRVLSLVERSLFVSSERSEDQSAKLNLLREITGLHNFKELADPEVTTSKFLGSVRDHLASTISKTVNNGHVVSETYATRFIAETEKYVSLGTDVQ